MPTPDPPRDPSVPADTAEANTSDEIEALVPPVVPPSPDDRDGGDRISVGDITHSVIAAGRGAKALVNNIDTYIQQYTERALTEAEEAEQARRMEHQRLAQAVQTYIQRLDGQLNEAREAPPRRNPYKYVHAYELSDADRFAGRVSLTEKLIDKAVCADSHCRLVVLDGETRIGKTSLLRVGLMPVLVGAEHLPLYVQIPPSPTKPIATIVKESLLPDLSATPLLAKAPLRVFIRQVKEMLPPGKRLFVLLDRFEAVTEMAGDAHAAIREELAACLLDDDRRDHWIISIDAADTSALNPLLQPAVPYPLANTLKIPPLSRAEARGAIVEPAKHYGLTYSDELVDRILKDAGGDSIDPSYVQVLCFALVEALPPDEKSLTVPLYEAQGGASGVLGSYLDRTMGYLPAESQEAGWLVMSTLLDQEDGRATDDELAASLRVEGVRDGETHNALDLLLHNGLLRERGDEYQLATRHFETRIRAWRREWIAQRAVAEHIRTEFRRQAQHILASALRGLVGGAVGFGLAFWIAFAGQGLDYIWQLALIRLVPGALAGVLTILAADVAQASYLGKKSRWLPWLWGGGGGAVGFGLAVPYHFYFFLPPATPLGMMVQSLVPAVLEGALWGAVTGLGVVWLMRGERTTARTVLKLAGVLAAGGLVLWLTDRGGPFGGAFVMPDPPFLLLVAGAVMPLCVIGAALLPGWTQLLRAASKDEAT